MLSAEIVDRMFAEREFSANCYRAAYHCDREAFERYIESLRPESNKTDSTPQGPLPDELVVTEEI